MLRHTPVVCVDESSEGGLNFSWEAELSRQRKGAKRNKKAIPICIKSFIITTCCKALNSPATVTGCQRMLKDRHSSSSASFSSVVVHCTSIKDEHERKDECAIMYTRDYFF